MRFAEPASSPAHDRVRTRHQQLTGLSPTHVAVGPAPTTLAGHCTDVYGGMTITALTEPGVAVAASARTDGVISVREFQSDGTEVTHGTTELSHLDSIHAPVGSAGAPFESAHRRSPHPLDSLPHHAARATHLGGLIWSMIHRQMLSRDTQGMDITVEMDVLPTSGAGYVEAIDAALSVALHCDAAGDGLSDAPIRARLADICWQSARHFGTSPVSRSRIVAALRGSAEGLTVIDFADGAVTSAPTLIGGPLELLELASTPTAAAGACADTVSTALLRAQHEFAEQAAQAFGVETVRLLPDAHHRVVDWLEAVCESRGPDGIPSPSHAHAWMSYWEAQTRLSAQAASALRSLDHTRALPMITSASRACAQLYGARDEGLTRACRDAGAVAAWLTCRPAEGTVLALVPGGQVDDYVRQLDRENPGMFAQVRRLHPAGPARCVQHSSH
ncbi:hypothetical protein ACUY3K_05985 [Corynebacterium uberis]|uniref:hypothetical protein n=1 Tax=Corynebacterium TaxID=1716 RepID=UPI001D09F991|nr:MULTISPECIES: hypothetical protein [Corynebacterium]MCZ9308242.1 hypothetical protein [Corynebacterium sp. c6VSa_13]UDL73922.1 hypothetical protein LH391_01455 [Corynebacterium uberis]UDL77406.1 hypothetical protein LH394_07940 [Corynebacterium uberis]UDL81823.1 hypothetical protein LH395_07945 [Corynebacterium uberis]UDL84033.1 hypothetical protein LH390_07945 [Corynebacterium uberis]